jgi:NhaP-type Na+/H+ or K+/H+ antiporter
VKASPTVISVGAVCFGIVIGYVTYRTLVRTNKSSISDLAAVVAAIGGGVVSGHFDVRGSDTFGWYSIGLLIGMAVFLILRLILERQKEDGEPGPVILGD